MLSVEWAAPETRLHHRQPFRKQARPILARPVGVNSVEHGAARCVRRRLCPLAGGRAATLSLAHNAHSNRGARCSATGMWEARRRSATAFRSEEHTSELQSLMRISYAVFCLKKKNNRP